MTVSKRSFLKIGGAALAASAAPAAFAATREEGGVLPSVANAKPIGRDERLARIAKAQKLMQEKGVSFLLLEPGAALTYFTGLRWWRSERLVAALIPREGEVGVVTPYFEEPSVQESLGVPASVRTWHENEDPFAVVAGYARDWKLAKGKAAMEESVRFFVADGVGRALPDAKVVPGAPITRPCRMIKSPAELALMQAANDVTIAAYAEVYAGLEVGMTSQDVSALMDAATRRRGGRPAFSMALFNEASAYPHGTDAPQVVKESGVVLMDCGCSVHGYRSDISRTFVYGEATKRQREVWNTVKRGQEIAYETARIGLPAGAVDRAVRSYYESLGWGPGYQTPGLSHRLGHGIGMEGHEPINLVESEETPLAAGMCFSNEPGLYAFGEFGVRLEDCFTMTADGPKPFTASAKSLDDPI